MKIFKQLRIFYILFLTLLVSLNMGCSIVESFQSTKIKRHRSAVYERITDTAKTDLVGISLFGTKVSSSRSKDPKPNLWSLTDRGQEELIKSINAKEKDSKNFYKSLERKYFADKKTIPTDYITKNLKIVLSISKDKNYSNLNIDSDDKGKVGFSTSDRIKYLKMHLKLQDSSPIFFSSWNKFETEYKTINVGDVSFSRSFSFTGGVNGSKDKDITTSQEDGLLSEVEVSSKSISPSVSATAANSNTENQKVLYRYLSLNGSMAKDEITLEQEGIREIDLSGNVVIDVQFKFKESPLALISFQGLFNKKIPNPTEKVSLIKTTVKVPSIKGIPGAIKADLNYNYVYRHVINKKGRKTFYEWDDKVKLYEGNKEIQNFTLFEVKDYVPKFTKITSGKLEFQLKNKFFKNRKKADFVLQDYLKAEKFMNWLFKISFQTRDQIGKLDKQIKDSKNKIGRKKLEKEKDILLKKYKVVFTLGDYHLYLGDNQPVSMEYVVKNGETFEDKLYFE